MIGMAIFLAVLILLSPIGATISFGILAFYACSRARGVKGSEPYVSGVVCLGLAVLCLLSAISVFTPFIPFIVAIVVGAAYVANKTICTEQPVRSVSSDYSPSSDEDEEDNGDKIRKEETKKDSKKRFRLLNALGKKPSDNPDTSDEDEDDIQMRPVSNTKQTKT